MASSNTILDYKKKKVKSLSYHCYLWQCFLCQLPVEYVGRVPLQLTPCILTLFVHCSFEVNFFRNMLHYEAAFSYKHWNSYTFLKSMKCAVEAYFISLAQDKYGFM